MQIDSKCKKYPTKYKGVTKEEIKARKNHNIRNISCVFGQKC